MTETQPKVFTPKGTPKPLLGAGALGLNAKSIDALDAELKKGLSASAAVQLAERLGMTVEEMDSYIEGLSGVVQQRRTPAKSPGKPVGEVVIVRGRGGSTAVYSSAAGRPRGFTKSPSSAGGVVKVKGKGSSSTWAKKREAIGQRPFSSLERIATKIETTKAAATDGRLAITLPYDMGVKAYQLARLTERAEAFFGNKDAAHRWLKQPRATLGGLSPLEFAKRPGGEDYLINLLGRTEYGAYS